MLSYADEHGAVVSMPFALFQASGIETMFFGVFFKLRTKNKHRHTHTNTQMVLKVTGDSGYRLVAAGILGRVGGENMGIDELGDWANWCFGELVSAQLVVALVYFW